MRRANPADQAQAGDVQTERGNPMTVYVTGDVHGRAEYGSSRFAFKNWPLRPVLEIKRYAAYSNSKV